MALLLLSVITFIFLVTTLLESLIGLKSIKSLASLDLSGDRSEYPLVSIIVTASNEENVIQQTINMLSQQHYPHIEIICVNDRSTDQTGLLLNELAQKDSRIKVININDLPAGWFGKNYASHTATKIACGEWLIFLDADVSLQPSALMRTIVYAQQNSLDHLTVFAYYHCQGFLYNIFHLVHKGHGYVLALKPWLAKSKKSRKSINSGVFCLVKKSVYEKVGGHAAIALECIDDLKLGSLIKQNGFNQDIVNAQDYISITWYDSLLNMCNGLKKNSYAYFNFKILPVLLGVSAWIALLIWPVMACFLTQGACQVFNILNTVLLVLIYLRIAHFFRIPKFYALFFPLGAIIYLYPMFLSVLHFSMNRGIYWRGTFYSAEMLRNR